MIWIKACVWAVLFLLFAVTTYAQSGLIKEPSKDQMVLATLRYIAQTYEEGVTPSLYRTNVRKCDKTFKVYYYDVKSQTELFLDSTTGWEDHWELVVQMFGITTDPHKLKLMQLYTEVVVCNEKQNIEHKLRVGKLKYAKADDEAEILWMVQPMPMEWFQRVAERHKAKAPEFKWWLTLAHQCYTNNKWVAVIQGNEKVAILKDFSNSEELFKGAAVIWPEVKDWLALKPIGSQHVVSPGRACVEV